MEAETSSRGAILGLMMTWDLLVQQWWLQVTSAVVAALVVAGILAFFSKTVRDKFWRPIGRALRWPLTVRLTTTRRQGAAAAETKKIRDDAELTAQRFNEVCDLLGVKPIRADSTIVRERIEQLQGAKDAAWGHAQEQIDATQSLAKKQLADQVRRGAEQAETAREFGKAEGRAEAIAEVEAERAVPLLRPVWRIDELGSADAFVLKNTQHSVEVSNISVEAASGEFLFAGATQMRGKLERHFEFYGQKTDRGRRLGVDFTVKWQDAHGTWWSQVVVIEREPRRMTVL